jgi:CBS domain-containing protein
MRVQDVMTEGVQTIAPTATAEEAWSLMRRLAPSGSSPSQTCSNSSAVVSIAGSS